MSPAAGGEEGSTLVEEVRRGAVDERAVDVRVRRVLRAKFESGLFENPYPAEHIDATAIAGEGAELSRRLARDSVVLVKNDGLLPLDPSSGLTVEVVGPHADAVTPQFPTHSYPAYRELLAVQARGQAGNAGGGRTGQGGLAQRRGRSRGAATFVHDSYGARPLCEEIAQFAKSVPRAGSAPPTSP